MKRVFRAVLPFLAGFYSALPASAGNIKINEAVVDPQQDYNQSGNTSPSDEFFEIYNPSSESIDLTGWTLELIDTTPETKTLEGIVSPFGFFVVMNPSGMQNNDGRLELYDSSKSLVDAFSYGAWKGNELNLPNGNAYLSNDSLSRYPDGETVFLKTSASPGSANVPEPLTGFLLLLSSLFAGGRKRFKSEFRNEEQSAIRQKRKGITKK